MKSLLLRLGSKPCVCTNYSFLSRRKPHVWIDRLLKPFLCDPVCHGRTDPSVPAGCRREPHYGWEFSCLHSSRDSIQSLYMAYVPHVTCQLRVHPAFPWPSEAGAAIWVKDKKIDSSVPSEIHEFGKLISQILYLYSDILRDRSFISGKFHTYLSMVTWIFPLSPLCKNPCIRVPHWRPKAAMSMLIPTLVNPYFFRKVIRKPNPINIITWTSLKSERRRCLTVTWEKNI